MLTADPELSGRLIVDAVISCQTESVKPDLHALSARVVTGWLGQRQRPPEAVEPDQATAMLTAVRRLPDLQRASLALCRFGDHTYRDAALLLGVPAVTVAGLLCSALQSLHTPDAAPDGMAVMA